MRLKAGSDASAHGGQNEAVQQLAFADRILLNKTDLVTPEELAGVRETVASISPHAHLIESTYSKVPIEEVVGIKAFDAGRVAEAMAVAEAPGRGWAKGGSKVGGVRTVALRGGDVDMLRFNEWMVWLLQEKGKEIFRFKGILAMAGHEEQFVVQVTPPLAAHILVIR